MKRITMDLNNLDEVFREWFCENDTSRAKTIFLKRLAENTHRFYNGKMQTLPKAGVFGFNWFNVWYTPGVSRISTAIRDDNERSYELSNRGNLVAVVSDSTRVLGDGDCTPPGGLGVMEGKAFLMKYLGGVDATALCINSRDASGKSNPQKIIDFVKMAEPSFGAVNLEDISQPNCYRVLDSLRKECDIPVWHDDAQGTACVTLAGLLNALKLTDRRINSTRIVLLGAGASNSTIARFLLQAGADPERMVIFDSKGSLHSGRADVESDHRYYRKWELCSATNPKKIETVEKAIEGADVLIALSKPGPDTIDPLWIRSMGKKSIVFACANPVPEIYPHAAKEAGAHIVATGRGDFPNQVNNSVGFPGILKGALLVRARGVSDGMAIRAAESLASFAEERGITPDNIIARMDEPGVFSREAADVAEKAVEEGLARVDLSWQDVFTQAERDITETRNLIHSMVDEGFIKQPPQELLDEAYEYTLKELE
jgi:malate dehydrogenase (oxaloacetate-decarboxylating)